MEEYDLFENDGPNFTEKDNRVFAQIVTLLDQIQKNQNPQLSFNLLQDILEPDEISSTISIEESSDESLSADWLLEQIKKKGQEAVAESLAQMKFGVKTLSEEHDGFVEQISIALTTMQLSGKEEEGFREVQRLLDS